MCPHESQADLSLPHHFLSATVRIAAALMKDPAHAPPNRAKIIIVIL
jgi:hypothetical protein